MIGHTDDVAGPGLVGKGAVVGEEHDGVGDGDGFLVADHGEFHAAAELAGDESTRTGRAAFTRRWSSSRVRSGSHAARIPDGGPMSLGGARARRAPTQRGRGSC